MSNNQRIAGLVEERPRKHVALWCVEWGMTLLITLFWTVAALITFTGIAVLGILLGG